MTYTPEEHKARYHARHRDEINTAQRARYHERKAAGTLPPSQRPASHRSVTGTMGAVETPDVIESVAPNLREKYLLALLTRDAKIWRQHHRASDQTMAPDDAMSPLEASRLTPHTQCVIPPRPMNEAEKEKRRAAWTPERRKEQGQRTAAHGKEGADHGVKGRKISGSDHPSRSSARAEAKASGKMTYTREQPCAKCGGHIYLVSNWSCVGCRSNRGKLFRSSVPRLSQFKRLGNDTFSDHSKSKSPQAKGRQFAAH